MKPRLKTMHHLGEMSKSNVEILPSSKEDRDIHEKAVLALHHYYKHKDSTSLSRIVGMLPNSNRRVAMLEWLRKYTVLRWDRNRERLIRNKLPEQQDLDGATASPFWTLKVKQEQRRHVSGNSFEPDHFFDRVLSDIRVNIDRLPLAKLDYAIVELQKIAANKRINAMKKDYRRGGNA